MKFVHAADLHIDSPLVGLERYPGAPVDLFRSATRRALENLVGLCLEEHADFLLLAGDLFDGDWKDYRSGLFFHAQMLRLKEAAIPVFLVRGNHDAESEITRSLRLPDHVHQFASDQPESDLATLARLGVAVHGQSYARRAVTTDLALGYPDRAPGLFNIGLLHTSLDGRPGHDPYAPTALDRLRAKGYDYWALGHVHRREVVSEDPFIVFPGNLQGRHAREDGAKGASLVTVEGGRVREVRHRPLDVVRYVRVAVDTSDATDRGDVLDAVKSELVRALEQAESRPIAARVRLFGRGPAHPSIVQDPARTTAEIQNLANDLGQASAWVERVEVETRSPIDLEAVGRRGDALGQLVRGLGELKRDEPALLALTAELRALASVLPPELREGPDGVRLDDPATFRRLLDGIEQSLVPRLLDDGDGS